MPQDRGSCFAGVRSGCSPNADLAFATRAGTGDGACGQCAKLHAPVLATPASARRPVCFCLRNASEVGSRLSCSNAGLLCWRLRDGGNGCTSHAVAAVTSHRQDHQGSGLAFKGR